MAIESFIPVNYFAALEKSLQGIDSPIDSIHLVETAVAVGVLLLLASVAASHALDFSLELALFLAFFSLALPPAVSFSVPHYLAAARVKKMESEIPDLLLQASSFPPGIGSHKLVSYLASHSTGELGKEFTSIERQLRAGATFEAAMAAFAKRADSGLLSRAVSLILQSARAGSDLTAALRATAEDLLDLQALYRERAAALTIERHTLLLSAALVVPALLAVAVGIVKSFDFSELASLGFSAELEQQKSVLAAALLGNHVYLSFFS